MKSEFWSGKKVLLTGHTGFKGSWLSLWLHQLGAEVNGYALESPTTPSIFEDAKVDSVINANIRGDVRNREFLAQALQQTEPDIIIHMAAQALVKDSYLDPIGTYATNVMGTVNLLDAALNTESVKVILNVTTDKCYANDGRRKAYNEDDPMGGHDPYSSSKACSELVTAAYRKSFMNKKFISVATARAGNVIGGGDWANNRIVPDAMRACMENKTLLIRNPDSTRPWQHVLEPLSGYIILCQKMFEQPEVYAQGWNFGPNEDDAQPVSELTKMLLNYWGNDANWKRDVTTHPHEAKYLKLDCSKANELLKWQPVWNLQRSLKETAQWYKMWHHKEDMKVFTMNQISNYQKELDSNEM